MSCGVLWCPAVISRTAIRVPLLSKEEMVVVLMLTMIIRFENLMGNGICEILSHSVRHGMYDQSSVTHSLVLKFLTGSLIN